VETVTLLHGFTLAGASWHDLEARMPRDWTFVAPDLRGHGRARTAPCTMDDCAADLVELWDHLGVERSHVVGYSMGGRLALHVAVNLPERTRSLLTIGAHAGLEGEVRMARRAADGALADRIEREGVEAFVRYWEALAMFEGVARRQPQLATALHDLRLGNSAAGLAASLRGMGAAAMEALWDDLDAIRVPCTFVAGAEDPGFVDHARRLAALVAGSRVEVVAESGHSVPFEQPAAMANVLADHLRWAATATSSSTRA
jgi:2-succinyl-6-hydroxy-2,4-cyclohexadiene-1-carboxylate synthase